MSVVVVGLMVSKMIFAALEMRLQKGVPTGVHWQASCPPSSLACSLKLANCSLVSLRSNTTGRKRFNSKREIEREQR